MSRPTLRTVWTGLLLAGSLATCPAGAADAGRGKEISTVCAACHGSDGNSTSVDFPRLAGQHEDYLLQALKAYRSGMRRNPIMQGQVATLSNEDLADLAAFFASQQGLQTRR